MKSITWLRGKKGWSVAETAREMGVSRQYLNNLEKHNLLKPTTKKIVDRICKVFEIEPFEFLGIDNLLYKPKNKEELEKIIEILRKEF